MPQIAAVKEAVKDSLVGSVTEEASDGLQMSAQTRAIFVANAVRDAETGEQYMGPEEFTNAIAPKTEDFVSL